MTAIEDFANPIEVIPILKNGDRDKLWLSTFMGLSVFETEILSKTTTLREIFNDFAESKQDYLYVDDFNVFMTKCEQDITICSGFQNQIVDTRGGYLFFIPNICAWRNWGIQEIVQYFNEKGCVVFKHRSNIQNSPFYKAKQEGKWGLDLLPMEPFQIKIYKDIGFSISFATDNPFDTALMYNQYRFEIESKYVSNMKFKLNEIPDDFFKAVNQIHAMAKRGKLPRDSPKEFLIKGTQNVLFPLWIKPAEQTQISLRTIYDTRVLSILSIYEDDTIIPLYEKLVAIAQAAPLEEAITGFPDHWNDDLRILNLVSQKMAINNHEIYFKGDLLMLKGIDEPINPTEVGSSYDTMPDHRKKQLKTVSCVIKKLWGLI